MSRTYDTVLVIGAEKLSSLVNWKDRNTCVLFGDGAGAVVIRATEAADAWKLAECIRQAIEQTPLNHHGDQIHITVSIGLTSGSLASDNIESLIQRADKYMYRAKNEGRNRSFTHADHDPSTAPAGSAVG